MHILIAILLAVVNLVFLASVIFGLPGTWLMILATALAAWWQRGQNFISLWTLVAMGILALAAEAVDLLAGMGLRRFDFIGGEVTQYGEGWLEVARHIRTWSDTTVEARKESTARP